MLERPSQSFHPDLMAKVRLESQKSANYERTHVCECYLPRASWQLTRLTKRETLIFLSIEPDLKGLGSLIRVVASKEYISWFQSG